MKASLERLTKPLQRKAATHPVAKTQKTSPHGDLGRGRRTERSQPRPAGSNSVAPSCCSAVSDTTQPSWPTCRAPAPPATTTAATKKHTTTLPPRAKLITSHNSTAHLSSAAEHHLARRPMDSYKKQLRPAPAQTHPWQQAHGTAAARQPWSRMQPWNTCDVSSYGHQYTCVARVTTRARRDLRTRVTIYTRVALTLS